MDRLSRRDLSKLLDTVSDLYTLRSHSEFIGYTVTNLHNLIPSDRISYNEMDLEQGAVRIVWSPADDLLQERMRPVFEAHMHEHPIAMQMRTKDDLRVIYKLSDLCPTVQFRRSALYQEYYKELGTKYQLAFSLHNSSHEIMPFAFSRNDRDFSERDRAVLSLLTPHLIQALHNAEQLSRLQTEVTALQRGLHACGIIVLRVSDQGLMTERSDLVRTVFQRYRLEETVSDRLPAVIWEWMGQSDRIGESALLATPRGPLRLSCATHEVTIRYVRQQGNRMLVMEEHATTIPASALLSLGLSLREAEVLSWVAQGKTNEDIATILALSPRTVQKHLEHIFDKLGVDTRTAAMARAMEAARHSRNEQSL